MSKVLQRKKVWTQVATRSATHYDGDTLDDMITDLQNLSKEYPEARINTYEDYGTTYMGIEIQRDETDTEMNIWVQAEAHKLARRREQYEALKKEFRED